jgi:hypothetical protein
MWNHGIVFPKPTTLVDFQFIISIFNLTWSLDKPISHQPPTHRKNVRLKTIMQVQKIFAFNFIFKLNFWLCHQIGSRLTCKWKVSGFHIAKSWITWPIFVDKYKLVHIAHLEMTLKWSVLKMLVIERNMFCFKLDN